MRFGIGVGVIAAEAAVPLVVVDAVAAVVVVPVWFPTDPGGAVTTVVGTDNADAVMPVIDVAVVAEFVVIVLVVAVGVVVSGVLLFSVVIAAATGGGVGLDSDSV